MEWTDQQRLNLGQELERWRGLRHLDRRALPGIGIDCVHLVFKCWEAAGLIGHRKLPAYNVRWGLASPENLMARAIEQLLFAARLPGGVPQFGDGIIFKAGTQSNHIGIVAPQDGNDPESPLACWHVMKGGTVHATPLTPVVRRSQELVRVIEPGWRTEPVEMNLEQLAKS